MIPLSDCKHGYVYELKSRNLSTGVFNKEDNGFIGIRLKFNYEFLFTEYHWDTGPPFGTAKPLELLEKIPEDIEMKETLGAIDKNSKRLVDFKDGWYFVDTEEYDKSIYPITLHNEKLFDYLKRFHG
jgi:hypothetical protein